MQGHVIVTIAWVIAALVYAVVIAAIVVDLIRDWWQRRGRWW